MGSSIDLLCSFDCRVFWLYKCYIGPLEEKSLNLQTLIFPKIMCLFAPTSRIVEWRWLVAHSWYVWQFVWEMECLFLFSKSTLLYSISVKRLLAWTRGEQRLDMLLTANMTTFWNQWRDLIEKVYKSQEYVSFGFSSYVLPQQRVPLLETNLINLPPTSRYFLSIWRFTHCCTRNI